MGSSVGLVLLVAGLFVSAGGAQSASPDPTGFFPIAPGNASPFAPVGGAPGSSPQARAELREQYEDIQEKERRRKAWLASDEAKTDRKESRDAYGEADDAAAVRLLKANFEEALRPQQPDTETLLDGGTVRDYLDEQTAVVEGAGNKRFLIDSQVPLRTDDPHKSDATPEPVDLDLVANKHGYVPDAGVARVTLPDKAQEGIAVGPAVVVPDGSGEVARVDSDTLAYPNIETDTDLAVSVTRNGFETFHQVRGPEAPEQIRLKLALPPGTSLKANEEGATVVRDDQTVMTISPPSAADAQGKNVPTSMEVEGDSLVLKTPHRGKDLAYPLLVDPEFDVKEDWACAGGCTATWFHNNAGALAGLQHWQPYMYGSAAWGASLYCLRWGSAFDNCYGTAHGGGSNWNGPSTGWSYGQTGLNLWAGGGNYYPAGQFYEYVYVPPGTTTRVNRADFGAQFMRRGWDTGAVLMFNGLYSYTTNNWVPGAAKVFDGSEDGSNDWQLTHHWNSHQAWNAAGPQGVAFGITNVGGNIQPSYYSTAYMGGAIIQLTDPEAPTLSSPAPTGATGTNGWAKEGDTLTFTAAAADAGLGVRRFRLTQGSTVLGESGIWCNGTKSLPCAAQADLHPSYSNQHGAVSAGQSHAAPFRVPASSLSEGPNSFALTAVDALGGQVSEGHASQATHTLKVDKAPPTVDAEGSLKPETGTWISRGEQTISVDATDSGAGATRAQLLIDGQPVSPEATQSCPSGGCELSHDFTIDTEDINQQQSGAQPLTAGTDHAVKLTVWDGAGRPTEVPWTVRIERDAPTLSLGGTLQALQAPADRNTTYTVTASSADNSSATQSGVRNLSLTVGNSGAREVEQDCTNACGFNHTFQVRGEDLESDNQPVAVTATDASGNTRTETFQAGGAQPAAADCATTPAATTVPGAEPRTNAQAIALAQSSNGFAAILQPYLSLPLNGGSIQPTLGSGSGGLFESAGGLLPVKLGSTSATAGEERAATSYDDQQCATPDARGSDSTTPSAPVNDTATVTANFLPATDLISRPLAGGSDAIVQLRSDSAPDEVSWNIGLLEGQALRLLDDGSAAVIANTDSTEPAPGLNSSSPSLPSRADRIDAITDPDKQLSQASDALERALAQTPHDVAMVFPRPFTRDANGNAVPATYQVTGNKLTLAVSHDGQSAYPLTASRQMLSSDSINEYEARRSDQQTANYTSAEADSYSGSGQADNPPSASSSASDGADPDPTSVNDGSAIEPTDEEVEELSTPTATASKGRQGSQSPQGVKNRLMNISLGLTESDPATFDNPRASGLTNIYRPIVPWRITGQVTNPTKGTGGRDDKIAARRWTQYYSRAKLANRRVDVAFARDFARTSPRANAPIGRKPSVSGYRNALTQFLNSYGSVVGNFSPWNEPNFELDPLYRDPVLAAQLWVAGQQVCRASSAPAKCGQIVAGEYAGSKYDKFKKTYKGKVRQYSSIYRLRLDAANHKPKVWGFHAYHDARLLALSRGADRYDLPITKRYYNAFAGYPGNPQIWLSAIGTPYRLSCAKWLDDNQEVDICGSNINDGAAKASQSADEQFILGQNRQRDAFAWVLNKIAKSYNGIDRIHYYNLHNTRGLLWPDLGGNARSGKCQPTSPPANPNPKPKTTCDIDDYGLIGADDDGGRTQDHAYPGASGRSQPGAPRWVYCLTRDRITNPGLVLKPKRMPSQKYPCS